MFAEESGSAEFFYSSGYLYEADLVAEELERAGIPFYRFIETMGERFQMSAAVLKPQALCLRAFGARCLGSGLCRRIFGAHAASVFCDRPNGLSM